MFRSGAVIGLYSGIYPENARLKCMQGRKYSSRAAGLTVKKA